MESTAFSSYKTDAELCLLDKPAVEEPTAATTQEPATSEKEGDNAEDKETGQ